ncbi:hypothetical protein HMPREF3156_02909 [Neisseria sp. HMSC06F02]|nr:hypothetical protein HMPREF3156_02909 [Neisseria sp. HMSC06F02]
MLWGLSIFNSFRVFSSPKRHLLRWKSLQGVQPCCGFRLESSALETKIHLEN